MSYESVAEEGKRGRKKSFPPGRVLFPLAGVLFPLLSPTPYGVLASARAEALSVEQLTERVRQEADRRLMNHIRAQGWVNYRHQVAAWVPPSADRLGQCEGRLRVAPAQDQARPWGRIPYVLSCDQPAWEIRARAEVSLVVPVVTARRNIARGETLSRAALELRALDLGSVYGDFVTDLRLLDGKRARRAIRSGQVVSPDLAEAPLLVNKGDIVLIRVERDGVLATMKGEALESGSHGQGILVRNLSSGKEITAWVAEPGIVESRF